MAGLTMENVITWRSANLRVECICDGSLNSWPGEIAGSTSFKTKGGGSS